MYSAHYRPFLVILIGTDPLPVAMFLWHVGAINHHIRQPARALDRFDGIPVNSNLCNGYEEKKITCWWSGAASSLH
jgi:hypothetical protein